MRKFNQSENAFIRVRCSTGRELFNKAANIGNNAEGTSKFTSADADDVEGSFASIPVMGKLDKQDSVMEVRKLQLAVDDASKTD